MFLNTAGNLTNSSWCHMHSNKKIFIPRMVLVGPGVRVRVTSMTEKPWDQYKEEGHKAWDCPKQTNCFHCKANTHASANCPYCLTCRKYGHPSKVCNISLNSKEDTSKERSNNQEDMTEPNRTAVKTMNNQLKNKIQKTKQNKNPA